MPHTLSMEFERGRCAGLRLGPSRGGLSAGRTGNAAGYREGEFSFPVTVPRFLEAVALGFWVDVGKDEG